MHNQSSNASLQGSTKEYIVYPKEINVSRKEAQILWHMVNHMRETTHMQEAMVTLDEICRVSHPELCDEYLTPLNDFFTAMVMANYNPAPATTGYEAKKMRLGQMKGLNAWHLAALNSLKERTGKTSPASLLFEFIVRIFMVRDQQDSIAESLAVIHEFFWHIKKVEFIP